MTTATAAARRRSALYLGSVVHARRDELVRRAFRYPVYVAAIDLDELDELHRALALFSHGGRNLFALHDRDYEGGAVGLLAAQRDLLAANGLPAPHTTRLVTQLRVCGYVFNPVSFFLHYDAAGALSSVVAEVNNTYGGRRRYVLGPEQRIAPPNARGIGFRHVRELFVSPFLHGPAIYDFWFDAPLDGERLAIAIDVRRPPHGESPRAGSPRAEPIFVARIAGRRRPLTDRALIAAAVRYPLMTAQVIGLIHLEALKLRLRGVPYLRPGPDHAPRQVAPGSLIRSRSSHVPPEHPSRRMK
ncbi:MAG TPA: DUF1365 domain-containing protein [Kofleriaceae bacterium]|nr:DUF1365 domain-containing protein [Kofleriaceae bacterium]